jgi:hypothetical protein
MLDTKDAEVTSRQLSRARERLAELHPFSPAWDAAMAGVEELERQVFRQDPSETQTQVLLP